MVPSYEQVHAQFDYEYDHADELRKYIKENDKLPDDFPILEGSNVNDCLTWTCFSLGLINQDEYSLIQASQYREYWNDFLVKVMAEHPDFSVVSDAKLFNAGEHPSYYAFKLAVPDLYTKDEWEKIGATVNPGAKGYSVELCDSKGNSKVVQMYTREQCSELPGMFPSHTGMQVDPSDPESVDIFNRAANAAYLNTTFSSETKIPSDVIRDYVFAKRYNLLECDDELRDYDVLAPYVDKPLEFLKELSSIQQQVSGLCETMDKTLIELNAQEHQKLDPRYEYYLRWEKDKTTEPVDEQLEKETREAGEQERRDLVNGVYEDGGAVIGGVIMDADEVAELAKDQREDRRDYATEDRDGSLDKTNTPSAADVIASVRKAREESPDNGVNRLRPYNGVN